VSSSGVQEGLAFFFVVSQLELLARRTAKDPAFKKYVSAMQEMMQDPATKLKMEQMASAMNTHLEL